MFEVTLYRINIRTLQLDPTVTKKIRISETNYGSWGSALTTYIPLKGYTGIHTEPYQSGSRTRYRHYLTFDNLQSFENLYDTKFGNIIYSAEKDGSAYVTNAYNKAFSSVYINIRDFFTDEDYGWATCPANVVDSSNPEDVRFAIVTVANSLVLYEYYIKPDGSLYWRGIYHIFPNSSSIYTRQNWFINPTTLGENNTFTNGTILNFNAFYLTNGIYHFNPTNYEGGLLGVRQLSDTEYPPPPPSTVYAGIGGAYSCINRTSMFFYDNFRAFVNVLYGASLTRVTEEFPTVCYRFGSEYNPLTDLGKELYMNGYRHKEGWMYVDGTFKKVWDVDPLNPN